MNCSNCCYALFFTDANGNIDTVDCYCSLRDCLVNLDDVCRDYHEV